MILDWYLWYPEALQKLSAFAASTVSALTDKLVDEEVNYLLR